MIFRPSFDCISSNESLAWVEAQERFLADKGDEVARLVRGGKTLDVEIGQRESMTRLRFLMDS